MYDLREYKAVDVHHYLTKTTHGYSGHLFALEELDNSQQEMSKHKMSNRTLTFPRSDNYNHSDSYIFSSAAKFNFCFREVQTTNKTSRSVREWRKRDTCLLCCDWSRFFRRCNPVRATRIQTDLLLCQYMELDRLARQVLSSP